MKPLTSPCRLFIEHLANLNQYFTREKQMTHYNYYSVTVFSEETQLDNPLETSSSCPGEKVINEAKTLMFFF